MTDRLVHRVETQAAIAVDTVLGLQGAMVELGYGVIDDLEDTYVIERIAETLSDGSCELSIRIRLAERI